MNNFQKIVFSFQFIICIGTTVKSAEMKVNKQNAFEISTPDTTFLLYADTGKEKDDWIGNVGRAIVRCSSTYQGNAPGAPKQSHKPNDDEDSDSSVDSDNPYTYKY